MSKNRRRRTARLRAEANDSSLRSAPLSPKNRGTGEPPDGKYEPGARKEKIELGEKGRMGMHAKSTLCGLANEIDANTLLSKAHLQAHKPYYESDHVLNIAYNALGAWRNRGAPLDGGGTSSTGYPRPAPTLDESPDLTTADCRGGDRRRGSPSGPR